MSSPKCMSRDVSSLRLWVCWHLTVWLGICYFCETRGMSAPNCMARDVTS